jgi:Probable molybdopterin binding domain
MTRLDETRPFISVRIAVLTVSDTRDLSGDKSGDTLVGMLTADGHTLADRAIVKDDVAQIRAKVQGWIANPDMDVVITRFEKEIDVPLKFRWHAPRLSSRPGPSGDHGGRDVGLHRVRSMPGSVSSFLRDRAVLHLIGVGAWISYKLNG